ncbi:FCD domain-containing protein [Thioclava sp. A2]|uniref:GntR family transcriptional regulator n=1 Tax=Thioclava sp. FCG-A2 TaxID=3080562 RepID=UPI0029537429|nr:FCD domain-containing protein [Thioclava sp. A2]MDV7270940.1 FCD domain-containing protein [Thioclava sp. A2]
MSHSLAQSVFMQMRADIIFGRLAPSRKLRLDELRASYGASVPTLREVLNRLASEGFVVAEDQRGFAVAPISAENLLELASLRRLIEMDALEHSIRNGDMEWEARVVAAHHKLARVEGAGVKDAATLDDWRRYDWEFHQTLISACGSQELMAVHAMVFDKYLRYQMLFLTDRGEISRVEHLHLKEAALARDVATAKGVLARHIEGGVKHALAAQRDQSAEQA